MNEISEQQSTASNIRFVETNAIDEISSAYAPQNIEIIDCLETEAKCCFVTSHILKTLAVIADVLSVGIMTTAATQISGNPQLASSLTIGGAISSGCSAAINLFLFKINSKLRKLDRKIGEQKAIRGEEI
jgi:hypothetical protein